MKNLKKIVIQEPLDVRYKDFFDKVEKYELLEIHRFSDDIIIATQFIRFKSSEYSPKNLMGINGIEFIEVLSENKIKNEYICLVKHQWPESFHNLFNQTDLILNAPIVSDGNTLTISFTIRNNEVEKFYKNIEKFGTEFKILSVSSQISPNTENIYMHLTDRQREIMFYAIEHGYYEIPRKISTKELAKKFEISQSALSEHLRKIERVIFGSVFESLKEKPTSFNSKEGKM